MLIESITPVFGSMRATHRPSVCAWQTGKGEAATGNGERGREERKWRERKRESRGRCLRAGGPRQERKRLRSLCRASVCE